MKKCMLTVLFALLFIMILPADVFGFKMGMTLEEVNKNSKKFNPLYVMVPVYGIFKFTMESMTDNMKVKRDSTIAKQAHEVTPKMKSKLFTKYHAFIDNNIGLYLIVTETKVHKFENCKSELVKLCDSLSNIYGDYVIKENKSKNQVLNFEYAVFQNSLPDNLSVVTIQPEIIHDNGFLGLGAGDRVKFITTFVFENAEKVLK